MKKIKHSEMVATLVKPGEQIIREMCIEDAHILHMAVGISGEAGELLDCIKKRSIYQKPIDLTNLVEELGDLEFYMEGLRQTFNITRQECLDANIKKLSKRYGEKLEYSNSAAINRADKSA